MKRSRIDLAQIRPKKHEGVQGSYSKGEAQLCRPKEAPASLTRIGTLLQCFGHQGVCNVLQSCSVLQPHRLQPEREHHAGKGYQSSSKRAHQNPVKFLTHHKSWFLGFFKRDFSRMALARVSWPTFSSNLDSKSQRGMEPGHFFNCGETKAGSMMEGRACAQLQNCIKAAGTKFLPLQV